MLNEKIKNYNGSQRNAANAKVIRRYLGCIIHFVKPFIFIDENERVYKMYYTVPNFNKQPLFIIQYKCI